MTLATEKKHNAIRRFLQMLLTDIRKKLIKKKKERRKTTVLVENNQPVPQCLAKSKNTDSYLS